MVFTWNNPSDECFEQYYHEFGTSKERIVEDAQLIKKWINSQPHLPHIDEKRYPAFPFDFIIQNVLIRCKCSVERAKQTLDLHFTLKTALPEFFADRDPFLPKIQYALNQMDIIPLPRVTKEGYRVTIFKFLEKNPSDFQMEHFLKMGFMMADVRVCEDKSLGDIFINDFRNISMTHVSKMPLTLIRKMDTCIREGYRARLKGIHFIHSPAIIELVMGIVKNVMTEKISSRHHVHNSLESLYQHVDRDVLPEEYGGTERKLSELRVDWAKKLQSYRQYFLDQDVYARVDESKRPGKSIDTNQLFGIEGSFRKLTVD